MGQRDSDDLVDQVAEEVTELADASGVGGLAGKTGFCGVSSGILVSHAGLHFGEEPPISGTKGSGTIFFSGCNLRCVFCQNYQISQEFQHGRTGIMSEDDLVSEMLQLQDEGAHNINFVSPSHMLFQMADAIKSARQKGLIVPVVYNSNGYDSVEALRQIRGLVDIYLPDIKYLDNRLGKQFSLVDDYADIVPDVLGEMLNQAGRIGMGPGTEEMWFAIFRWNAIGYVKDDDKDKIDADALLTQLKEGTEAANKEREKHGWTKVHVLGWESPPAYDEQTHTLGWAVRGQTEGSPGESINYFTRLLGRHGVMSVELVAGADVYGAALVEFRKALKGYSFQPGKTYAEYRKGDAVAGIGLAALIAGGAGAAAMKSGLLAKFWKAIVAAVLALAAAVKALFSRLFGRCRDEVIEPPAGSTVPPAAS